jgi:hypothetical protein
MNRLRDESAFDPMSERGIDLLRQVQPLPPPPEMKRRVWAALQQTPHAAPSLRPKMLRAVVLVGGIIAFGATAGAAIGGRWIARHVERLRSSPATTSVMPAAPPRREHVRPVRMLAEAPVTAPEVTPPVEEQAIPVGLDRSRAHRVVAAAPAPSRVSERTQVLDALIALRRDHDPRRASELLDAYLTDNRHGALREEALVLALEAADARGDVVHAVRLSHTYQSEFPHGRFASFVQSHIKD